MHLAASFQAIRRSGLAASYLAMAFLIDSLPPSVARNLRHLSVLHLRHLYTCMRPLFLVFLEPFLYKFSVVPQYWHFIFSTLPECREYMQYTTYSSYVEPPLYHALPGWQFV